MFPRTRGGCSSPPNRGGSLDVWTLPIDGGEMVRMTSDFEPERGALYFLWEDNLGDIWVMDVVKP